jgi:alpha-beta hydrolase superfamily lysophospholipase
MKKWSHSEGTFTSFDGTELFCRTWRPQAPSDRALIVIHRGHEHSGRVEQQIEDLDLENFWAFSWDNRGHGRSPGERGYADRYETLIKDLDAFVNHVTRKYGIPIGNLAILANSVGAVTASAWVHDYAPPIRAMILAAPAFRIRLYIPFAIPLLRLLQRIKGKAFISSYVKSKMLTHDPEQSRKYDEDELITRNIAVNILLGLHDTATRIMADAGAIHTPTLILAAGSDWVVQTSAQQRFFDRLSSQTKEMRVYPGFYHAVLYEKDRHVPIARAREFVLEAFAHETSTRFLLKADREGYTRVEYDELRQPAAFPRSLSFAFQRLSIKTLGKLSDGIRIGLRTGFDSGKSLDYVYENRARGRTPLGRFMDRCYLDAIGWKGIRERGTNLEVCLKATIERVSNSGKPVRVMDVATGCGRYLLNVLKANPDGDISALLRDRDPNNLEAAGTLADSMGLHNVTFEQGDAFDTVSLLAVRPRPNIVIVSGLFELFSDNQPILNSLKGISGVLEDDGYLIYTCQPWHPQVELIARTLSNSEGKAWIMRRRTQAEMDELVRSVGLEKSETTIDAFGIFTVSVAQKQETHE